MNPRIRSMIGVVTAAVFLWLGGTLWTEEQPLVGGVLLALGALRAGVAFVQIRNAFFVSEPDEDE